MIVVADAGPIHYLVLIEAIDVLLPLYERVLVPQAVARELQQANAPAVVKGWIRQPPQWCEILPDPDLNTALRGLDPGEHAAITLALAVKANRVLIDDYAGRAEAIRWHLEVTGTLGALAQAHRAGLLDFETALGRLRETSFYLSETLVARTRRLLSTC